MKAPLLLTLTAVACFAQSARLIGLRFGSQNPPTYTRATHIMVDLSGRTEALNYSWGNAWVEPRDFQFPNVPAGHRVRILRVRGDLTAFPRPSENTNPLGGFSNVFIELGPTGRTETAQFEAGNRCIVCGSAGGAAELIYHMPMHYPFLHYQSTLGPSVFHTRIPINDEIDEPLALDHKLRVTIGARLNTIGVIHAEAALIVNYRLEPID